MYTPTSPPPPPDSGLDFLVIFLVLFVIGGGALLGAALVRRRAEKRQRGLMGLAAELGLQFNASDEIDIPTRFGYFEPLAAGERQASNVISGKFNGHEVLAFDFWSRLGKVSSSLSAVIAPLGHKFPGLEIYPEGMFSKAAEALADIDFESQEFSSKFLVKCPDRKFAYAVITPQVMEFLLANPGWKLDMRGSAVIAYTGKVWRPEEFKQAIKVLTGLLDLIPDYIWKDRAGGMPG